MGKRRGLAALAVVLAAVTACAAVHPDQAGMFDRWERHIGPLAVVLGAIDRSAVVVATDAHALAALVPRTGEVRWRVAAASGEALLAAALAPDSFGAVALALIRDARGIVRLRAYGSGEGDWIGECTVESGGGGGGGTPALALRHNGEGAPLHVAALTPAGRVYVVSLAMPAAIGVAVVAERWPAFAAGEAGWAAVALPAGSNEVLAVAHETGEVISLSAKVPPPRGNETAAPREVAARWLAQQIRLDDGATVLAAAGIDSTEPRALLVHGHVSRPRAKAAARADGEASVTDWCDAAAAAAVVEADGAARWLRVSRVAASDASHLTPAALFQATADDGSLALLRVDIQRSGAGDGSTGRPCLQLAAAVVHRSAAAQPTAYSAAVDAAGHITVYAVTTRAGGEGGQDGSQRLAAQVAASTAPLGETQPCQIGSTAGTDLGDEVRRHGDIVRAFALPFEKGGAPDPSGRVAGCRWAIVHEDGALTLVQGQRVLYSRPEGRALTVQALQVDVSSRRGTAAAAAPAGAGADGDSDAALTLGARLADQARAARALVSGALAAAAASLQAAAADPTGAARAAYALLTGSAPRAGEGSQLLPRRAGGAIAFNLTAPSRPVPSLPDVAGTTKLLVSRTSPAVAGSTVGASWWPRPLKAAVAAVDFDSGVLRWSRLTDDADSAAGQGWATLLLSRPRPLRELGSELLLLREGAGAGGGGTTLRAAWIDAATGADNGLSTTLASRVPIAGILRTSLVDDASLREVFALVYAAEAAGDGAAGEQTRHVELLPTSPQLLRAVAAGSHAAHMLAVLEYDAATDAQVLVGLAVSASGGRAAAVPVWQQVVATEVSDGMAGQRVLAFAPPHGHVPVRVRDVDAEGSSGTAQAGSSGAVTSGSLLASALASLDVEGHVPPARILGDDSLLIKYLHPHLAVIVVGTPGHVRGGFEAAHPRLYPAAAATVRTAIAPAVQVFMVDVVSGRMLHARRHVGSTGPVALSVHENWLTYTLWNAKAQRSELAVCTLYEGVVDTFDLNPLHKRLPPSLMRPTLTSATMDPPIVVHRSFVLPVTVTAITPVMTRFGLTLPHLLLATLHDGIVLLDQRLIDPRRPSKEPTDAEKAEGLVAYSPFLPLRHQWMLTADAAVGRLANLVSAPSAFESTTLVAAMGLDEFFTRTAPAKAFDQLDTDFNAPFFLAVVAAVGIATAALHRFMAMRDYRTAWK